MMTFFEQCIFYYDLMKHYIKHGRKFDSKVLLKGKEGNIPKVIHYCWFGKAPYNDVVNNCIDSWKKYLPDYKFVVWNEDNFPVNAYPFARQAYNDKKWAYVSDVARLHALYNYGGIYMDTDVEVLKNIDNFLVHDFFSGFESNIHLTSAVMGAKPHNAFIKLLLDWYIGESYGKQYYEIANTRIITRIVRLYLDLKKGERCFSLGNCYYYPREYFCPELLTSGWNITENTYTIHHCTDLGRSRE